MRRMIGIVLLMMFSFLFVENVQALEVPNLGDSVVLMECETVLGDPTDPDSFAYLLQDIFDVFKLAVPLLILGLTIVEFTKAIVGNDKDQIMKAAKVTVMRFILGVALFFLPTVINFVFDLLGWYGTCGIG